MSKTVKRSTHTYSQEEERNASSVQPRTNSLSVQPSTHDYRPNLVGRPRGSVRRRQYEGWLTWMRGYRRLAGCTEREGGGGGLETAKAPHHENTNRVAVKNEHFWRLVINPICVYYYVYYYFQLCLSTPQMLVLESLLKPASVVRFTVELFWTVQIVLPVVYCKSFEQIKHK